MEPVYHIKESGKMKIEFKISENFFQIIAQLESGEIKGFPVVEIFDHKELSKKTNISRMWEIVDENYNSSAIVRLFQNERIDICTAFSSYDYNLYNPACYSSAQVSLFGNSAYCTYEGAFRGLLEQKLLPYITPEFNGDEEVKSSLKWCTLAEYCEIQKKFFEFREQNDANTPYHTFPRAIFEWLKNK